VSEEQPATDRRVVVRVLLRRATVAAEPATARRVGDYVAYVSGVAQPNRWVGATVSEGDVEGIVWTTARQATAVVRNLRKVASVVDARADDGTPPPRVPIGRLR
jgi:hypothetical protein